MPQCVLKLWLTEDFEYLHRYELWIWDQKIPALDYESLVSTEQRRTHCVPIGDGSHSNVSNLYLRYRVRILVAELGTLTEIYHPLLWLLLQLSDNELNIQHRCIRYWPGDLTQYSDQTTDWKVGVRFSGEAAIISFRHRLQTGSRTIQLPFQWISRFFLLDKVPGARRWQLTSTLCRG